MSPTRWPWRRQLLPRQLTVALDPEEQIQRTADLVDGRTLATSRFGLWAVDGAGAARLGWELVAKARLTGRVLSIIPTRVVDELADGTQVLIDEALREYTLVGRSGLTDVVHARVRRSVAASRYLPYPGGGGWVVLRRIPGRDGLSRQVRLDPGADVRAIGFAAAVAVVAEELASVPQSF